MNIENVKVLIAKLPDYVQNDGRLKEGGSFCVLGVGCDIYLKLYSEITWNLDGSLLEIEDGDGGMPQIIRDWYGFSAKQQLELQEKNDGDDYFLYLDGDIQPQMLKYEKHDFFELAEVLKGWVKEEESQFVENNISEIICEAEIESV